MTEYFPSEMSYAALLSPDIVIFKRRRIILTIPVPSKQILPYLPYTGKKVCPAYNPF